MSTGAGFSWCWEEHGHGWRPEHSSREHQTIEELMRGSGRQILGPHNGLGVLQALPRHPSPSTATIIINLLPCDGLPEAKSRFPISATLL